MDREQTNPLIIPEFDDTSVKIGVIPWSFGVEGQTLISATPFLDLRQRFLSSQKLLEYTAKDTSDPFHQRSIQHRHMFPEYG